MRLESRFLPQPSSATSADRSGSRDTSAVDGSTCSARHFQRQLRSRGSMVLSPACPRPAAPVIHQHQGRLPRRLKEALPWRARLWEVRQGDTPRKALHTKFRGNESLRLERTSFLPRFQRQLSAGAPWCSPCLSSTSGSGNSSAPRTIGSSPGRSASLPSSSLGGS